MFILFNPTALRKAKIVYNFGFSECNRVKMQRALHLMKERSFCFADHAKMNIQLYTNYDF